MCNTKDYSATYFYQIKSKLETNDSIYIGHTIDFKRRCRQHKTVCVDTNHSNYNAPVYQHIRNTGGWDNFEIIIIEQSSFSSVVEVRKRERKLIEQYDTQFNMRVPSRTSIDWYNEHKDHVLELKKQRYENNKEKHLDAMKQYNEQNKARISEWKKCKCVCEVCGGTYQQSDKSRHIKTQKHQKLLIE